MIVVNITSTRVPLAKVQVRTSPTSVKWGCILFPQGGRSKKLWKQCNPCLVILECRKNITVFIKVEVIKEKVKVGMTTPMISQGKDKIAKQTN